LNVDLSAIDEDDDPVTFFAQVVGSREIPSGSTITDQLNGTATLQWRTTAENAGIHRLRVGAFDDGGGSSVADFVIAVCREIDDILSQSNTIAAIFEGELGTLCRTTDRNGDLRISAADLVGR
jgi:hypothetical protein